MNLLMAPTIHVSDLQIRAWQINDTCVQVLELIDYLDRRGMLSYRVAAAR